MRSSAGVIGLVAVLASGTGCFTNVPDVRPAEVEGFYHLYLANADNGCQFSGFDPVPPDGMPPAPVELTLWQLPDRSRLRAKVGGIVGALLPFWLGSSDLTGRVDGRAIDLELFSPNVQRGPGACVYTVKVIATATFEDQNLRQGAIRYSILTSNMANDCRSMPEGCETIQTFNGTRIASAPPQPDGGQ